MKMNWLKKLAMIAAWASLLAVGYSCSDDIIPDRDVPDVSGKSFVKSEEIRFAATTANMENDGVQTRSSMVGEIREILLDDNVFYLNTLVEKRTDKPFDADDRRAAGQGEVQTRAKRVTKDDIDKFFVTGYNYATQFSSSSVWDGMRNVTVPMPTDGTILWKPGNKDYYWPGKGTFLCFTAVANCDTTVAKVSPDGKSFTYTVPAAAQNQMDILAAVSDELPGDYGLPVSLNFRHTLASIRIKMSSMASSFTITKWELTGIPSTGTYNIIDSLWIVQATTANYATQTLSWKTSASYNGDSSIIGGNGDANTFNVIPQTLPAGAKLKLTYKVGNGPEQTNEIDISGDVWEAGKIFTYYLTKTTSTYYLEVVSPKFDNTGKMTDSLRIRSYKHIDDGTAIGQDIPVEWQIQTVANVSGTDTTWADMTDANLPQDWFTNLTTNAVPATIALQSYRGNMSRQPLIYEPDEFTIKLRNEAIVGSANNPRDLSLYDIGGKTLLSGGRTTANCYVVQQPGWYKIPMVYGNAIKNGTTNTGAYTSTTTGSTILQNFVRHDGNPITDPWLKNNGINIDTVKLVWQDEWDIVKNIHKDGDYVSFYVDPNFIHEGNALIAAYTDYNGEEAAAWSWHIWITADELTSVDMTNYTNHTYSFLPVDIGACNGTEPKYSLARDTFFRVVQKEGGEVVETSKSTPRKMTVHQEEFRLNHQQRYGCTFYQWGRKDPMLPSDGIGSGMANYISNTHTKNKTYYGPDGYMNDGSWSAQDLNSGNLIGADAVALFIRNPGVMNISRRSGYATSGTNSATRYGWVMDGAYMNLWSANASAVINNSNTIPDASIEDETLNNDKVVKTVYDPSPTGYVMPPGNARTGTTTNGGNQSSSSNWNGIWNSSTRYFHFYTGRNKTGNLVPHYTNGYRNPGQNGDVSNESGSSTSCGNFCRKWLSVAWNLGNDGRAVNSFFSSSNVYPREVFFSKGFGFSVQPVREDSPAWQ